ncbi:FG-GAP repeat domain-containing protein [Micromonospora zamorensis]|uniref:FG-GAP repeat domain-containing protein n=1 Tax=Micromonospora zamorensis TaxID=709883 RepID=UPI003D97FF83
MSLSRADLAVLVAGLTTTVVLTTATGQPAWATGQSTTTTVTASTTLVADPTNLATDEEKVAAARVLGINPGIDMLVLNDQEFVFSIWRQARDGSFVKAEALRTYASDDSNAAYAFITTGIFAASADDAQAEIAAERAKALRRSVAVTVGLDPSDTALIEKNDRDFIFSVWQRVNVGSHVWTAARDAIADGTDQDDWTAFLTVGASAAHAQDVTDAIAEADAELAARLAAEQLATAKKSLLQLLLLPVSDELVAAPNRQFVLHVHNNAKGVEVKLASQVALNTPDQQLEQALKDFVFTGGAAANKRDEDAAAAKELAGYVAQITKIRDDARADGYSPNLLAAADRALVENTLVATQTFLLKGQEDARALDVAFRQKRTWDFNGDKKPDIVAADSTTGILWLYTRKGDGTVEDTRIRIGTGWAKWTAVFSPGDFNGDGLNDVIARNTAGELLLYRGNGRGGWLNGTAPDVIGSSGWNQYNAMFSPGDFNGDGFADLIARNSAGQLKLYRGNGRGYWLNGSSPDIIGNSGWNQYNAMFSPGDFNGDGFADLIGRNSAGQLKLYRGNGRGAWLNGSSPETIGTGFSSFNMIFSTGDWNSDGRADVITRNAAGELRLYRGNGKGNWINPAANILIGRSGWNAFKFVF